MAKEYYQTLGLQPGASVKDIRSAFRRLARKYHPDLNPEDKRAETRFKEINEAYQVLSNPEKRKQYNQFGFQNQRPGARGSRPGPSSFSWFDMARRRGPAQTEMGFSSVIDDLLKGASHPNTQQKRTKTPRVTVNISLEEAFTGTSRLLELSGRSRAVEAEIPRGVRDGEQVRLKIPETPDLSLNIELTKHSLFETRGVDLIYTAEIDLVDAMLGSEIIVPTIEGKPIALKIPPETQNGRVFRLRSKGMLNGIGSRSDDRGDLLVKVHVVLPDGLNKKQREIFEQLRESLNASKEK